ncbi:unnamed protein product [Blepharisma stoltei]|uniref:Uncharacterized protein n=1 Tax=Blepharisma stoltei TaxID=1481888 RepID=A0AAU9JVC6_9CILI|nr:unnamed protein product [Blepharisma stoltei]
MNKQKYYNDELSSTPKTFYRSITTVRNFTPIRLSSLKAERAFYHIRKEKSKKQKIDSPTKSISPWHLYEINSNSHSPKIYHRHTVSDIPIKEEINDTCKDINELTCVCNVPNFSAKRNNIFKSADFDNDEIDAMRELTATPIKRFICTRPSKTLNI